jgi:hypothetical protein
MNAETRIVINRAPVLTLWSAIVAERLGHDEDAALSLGRAVAGLTAQSKGRRLGIYKAPPDEPGKRRAKSGLGEDRWIELCGRAIPAKMTRDGLRAVTGDVPLQPEPVRAYLRKAFGENLERVTAARRELAKAHPPAALNAAAFGLYEKFRPTVSAGQAGWGQKGELKLEVIRKLARDA